MKWKDVTNALPKDAEEVIINCDGKFHLAIFEKNSQTFRLQNGSKIPCQQTPIFWSSIEPPPK